MFKLWLHLESLGYKEPLSCEGQMFFFVSHPAYDDYVTKCHYKKIHIIKVNIKPPLHL